MLLLLPASQSSKRSFSWHGRNINAERRQVSVKQSLKRRYLAINFYIAFTKYAQRAMDYALDLGLSDARLLNEIARSSAERIVLQAIWASVVRLHVMPAAG